MRHCRCDSARRVDRPLVSHQLALPLQTPVSLFGLRTVSPSRPIGFGAAARSRGQDWPKATAEGGAVLTAASTAAGSCGRDDAELGARQLSPYRMTAQACRAILLANATAATIIGLRARSWHSQASLCRTFERNIAAMAPPTSKRRRVELPRLQM